MSENYPSVFSSSITNVPDTIRNQVIKDRSIGACWPHEDDWDEDRPFHLVCFQNLSIYLNEAHRALDHQLIEIEHASAGLHSPSTPPVMRGKMDRVDNLVFVARVLSRYSEGLVNDLSDAWRVAEDTWP